MEKLKYINFSIILLVIGFLVYDHYISIPYSLPNEISVERLNIVGDDGNRYIVLSNPDNQAIPTQNGVPLDSTYERNVPGIIFFNREGDEIGGLIYDIYKSGNFQMLTFDQRKNDQVLTLRLDENFSNEKWNRRYGLQVLERSDKTSVERVKEYDAIAAIEDSALRKQKFDDYFSSPENIGILKMHVGRLFNGRTGLFLFDDDGNTRLAIYLDDDGNPVIDQIKNEYKSLHTHEKYN